MALKWKCILSADNILIDYVQVDASTLQSGDVAFDDKPDLEYGRYRWNGEQFELAQSGQWFVPDGPDAWYAMFRALVYLQTLPQVDFPAPVKLWLRYYYQSFKRPNDPDPGA